MILPFVIVGCWKGYLQKMRKGYDADIITLSCISSVQDTKPEKIRINPYGSTNCIRLEGIISAPSMGAPF